MDLNNLINYLPFLTAGNKHPHINQSKIIESVVIAVLTTMALKFFTIDALKLEVENLKDQIVVLTHRMDKMQGDLYIPRGSKETQK